MSAPSEHHATVGPLWVELEAAVRRFGGAGPDMEARIDSLRGRVSASTINTLHRLRQERNGLTHNGIPLSSPSDWDTSWSKSPSSSASSFSWGIPPTR